MPAPTPDFRASVTQRDDITVLALSGRFDFNAHPAWREASRQVLESPNRRQVDIDLTQVSYIDSAALGMLLMLREKAGLPDGQVRLCGANETVQRVIDIARFERLFGIARR